MHSYLAPHEQHEEEKNQTTWWELSQEEHEVQIVHLAFLFDALP
jgi:hypothetical protein